MALTLAYAVLALRPDETPLRGPSAAVRAQPPFVGGCRKQVPTLREYPDSLCSAALVQVQGRCGVCHGGRLTWTTVNLRDTHHPTHG